MLGALTKPKLPGQGEGNTQFQQPPANYSGGGRAREEGEMRITVEVHGSLKDWDLIRGL